MDVNSIYLYYIYIYVLYFLCLCALYVSVCLLFILFDVCTVFTETNSCCWCKILLGNKSVFDSDSDYFMYIQLFISY